MRANGFAHHRAHRASSASLSVRTKVRKRIYWLSVEYFSRVVFATLRKNPDRVNPVGGIALLRGFAETTLPVLTSALRSATLEDFCVDTFTGVG